LRIAVNRSEHTGAASCASTNGDEADESEDSPLQLRGAGRSKRTASTVALGDARLKPGPTVWPYSLALQFPYTSKITGRIRGRLEVCLLM